MKDAMGNVLHKGDLVMVQLLQPHVYGRIVELSEGGLVVQGMNQAGRVVVATSHIVYADASGTVGPVVALRDDQGKAEVRPDDSGDIAPLRN